MSLPYATAEEDEDLVLTAEAEAGGDAGAGTAELTQWRQPLRRSLRETWESRHLLRPMGAYSVPDYAQTQIGRWWLFLRPGLPIIAYSIVFAGIFGAKAPHGIPYLVFLLFGMQGWQLFQRTVVFETRSFQVLGKFTRTLNVPLLFVATAAISRALAIFFVYAVFGVGALAYYGIAHHKLYLELGPQLLVGLAGWVVALLYGWGTGLFTAALNSRYRDVRFTLPVFMQFLMFCTPVVYALDQVPKQFQPLAQVNPLTGVMEMVKYGFLGAGELRPIGIAWSLVALVGTVLLGLLFFNRFALVRSRESDDDDEEDGL